MRAEHFIAVSILDPAIATERMPVETVRRYIETRDMALIEQHTDMSRATVFHVREVPAVLWDSFVQAGSTESEQYRRAFMCGVTRVDNLVGRDGVALPQWSPVGKLSDQVVMTDDEVRSRFAPSEWDEIGSVVYRHSFLPRRIAAFYRLRFLFLELLGQRVFLAAEMNPNAAA